jgi:hypothetical protein
VAEKRLPGCERRKRYGRRMDVIERFRLGREIVRMDGNEFRSAAITVKRSKAVYFFANFGDLRIGCELFDDTGSVERFFYVLKDCGERDRIRQRRDELVG